MREVILEIPETGNSYTDKHATDSDGNRWVRIDLVNETIAGLENELSALREKNGGMLSTLTKLSAMRLGNFVDTIVDNSLAKAKGEL